MVFERTKWAFLLMIGAPRISRINHLTYPVSRVNPSSPVSTCTVVPGFGSAANR